MTPIIRPEMIEKWPLEKHKGVVSKLLVDGQNMTVLWSCWEPNASTPEHVHTHEQIGICLEGQIIFKIDGKEQGSRQESSISFRPTDLMLNEMRVQSQQS